VDGYLGEKVVSEKEYRSAMVGGQVAEAMYRRVWGVLAEEKCDMLEMEDLDGASELSC
jgi:hypothetical protein